MVKAVLPTWFWNVIWLRKVLGLSFGRRSPSSYTTGGVILGFRNQNLPTSPYRYITDWPDHVVNALELALKHKKLVDIEGVAFTTGDPYRGGGILAIYHLWEKYGMDKVYSNWGLSPELIRKSVVTKGQLGVAETAQVRPLTWRWLLGLGRGRRDFRKTLQGKRWRLGLKTM